MVTLEALLQGIQGVKDIPESTRKSVDHVHSDVFRGAVKEEKSLVRRLNGLVKAYREGRLSKEAALKGAMEVEAKRQAVLSEIVLRHAKRVLHKDVNVIPPEMNESFTKRREENLKYFGKILDDVKVLKA